MRESWKNVFGALEGPGKVLESFFTKRVGTLLYVLWCCSLHTGSMPLSSSSVWRTRWASMPSTRTTLRWRSTTRTLPTYPSSLLVPRMPSARAIRDWLTTREQGSSPVTSNVVLITRHVLRTDWMLKGSFKMVRDSLQWNTYKPVHIFWPLYHRRGGNVMASVSPSKGLYKKSCDFLQTLKDCGPLL